MIGFAGFALAILFYTYVGYPVAVGLWARLRPAHVASGDAYLPTLSVCIAAWNGESHLAPKLDSLLALDYPRDRLEIIVCDDGSSDRTREIAQAYADRDPRIRVIANETRVGKPTAINRLAQAARGEVLLMTDVRQRVDAQAARALVRPLADPSVGCVSGNLLLKGPTGAGAYWRYEQLIRGFEGKLGAMVGVNGPMYAVRRTDTPVVPADLILDDMFVPLSVALAGKRVVFARDAAAYDDAFGDKREFGRKARTLAGNFQLIARMPRLLAPVRNPVWWEFVSHKLLRLLCPWALLALFAASIVALLPGSTWGPVELVFWRLLLVGQASFYLLAALGPQAGRFAGLARTFVVLNSAAVVGLWRFVRGSQAVTW